MELSLISLFTDANQQPEGETCRVRPCNKHASVPVTHGASSVHAGTFGFPNLAAFQTQCFWVLLEASSQRHSGEVPGHWRLIHRPAPPLAQMPGWGPGKF